MKKSLTHEDKNIPFGMHFGTAVHVAEQFACPEEAKFKLLVREVSWIFNVQKYSKRS